MTKTVTVSVTRDRRGRRWWGVWPKEPDYSRVSGIWHSNDTGLLDFALTRPALAVIHKLRFKGGPRSIAKIETKRRVNP